MKYFSYDPNGEFEFHDTAEQAKACAERAVDYARDSAADSDWAWFENEHQICWGEVRGQCEVTDRPLTAEERADNPEWSAIRSIALVDTETPAVSSKEGAREG